MKTKINKSEVLKNAWKKYRTYNGMLSWSRCMKEAWMLAKKPISNEVRIEIRNKKIKFGATLAQTEYMMSLGLTTNMMRNRIMNVVDKPTASEIINLLKAGKKVDLVLI